MGDEEKEREDAKERESRKGRLKNENVGRREK